MNTIDAFANDIARQPEYVRKFRAGRPIPRKDHNGVVFSGSGDSLAASMLASAFSDYSMIAVDPMELAKNIKMAKGKHVYFVSVSGRTKANISAARKLKNTTAITKDPKSRLGAACKSIIPLIYDDSRVLTSGSIGFVACALECISKAVRVDIKGINRLFNCARKEAGRICLSGKVFLLGGQYSYPVAMYGAAKLYEVAGLDAHYERMEQFFHMGLFCAKRGDTVVMLDGVSSDLQEALRKLGLVVHVPKSGTKSKVGQVLFCTFLVQFVALNLARKNRQKECHFVLEKRIRAASSQTIY